MHHNDFHWRHVQRFVACSCIWYGCSPRIAPNSLNACLIWPEHSVKTEQIFEAILSTEIMSVDLGRFQESRYTGKTNTLRTDEALFRTLSVPCPWPCQFDDDHSEESLVRWICMGKRRRLAFAFSQCGTCFKIL